MLRSDSTPRRQAYPHHVPPHRIPTRPYSEPIARLEAGVRAALDDVRMAQQRTIGEPHLIEHILGLFAKDDQCVEARIDGSVPMDRRAMKDAVTALLAQHGVKPQVDLRFVGAVDEAMRKIRAVQQRSPDGACAEHDIVDLRVLPQGAVAVYVRRDARFNDRELGDLVNRYFVRTGKGPSPILFVAA